MGGVDQRAANACVAVPGVRYDGRMRQGTVCFVVAFAVLGCGEVKDQTPAQIDAPAADAPGTCTGNTIEACGASCQACVAPSDRSVAACSGSACTFACEDNAPSCSDNSCSKLAWTFEDGQLSGATATQPSDLALAVRGLNGDMAIAMDRTAINGELRIRIPLCLSGNLDLRSRTLSVQTFFQGGDPTGEQYYIQASVPSPQTGAFLGSRGVQANMWVTLSAPFSMSQFSETSSDLVIQLGSYGAAFSGTIWLDDISIQ